ncbi:S41 family peptidase [Phenylobacterium sp.]|uniref:S41 family peptidase n=1 Tax=Phenylobacterium sp. TaxID=1871053 RepID=UPI00289CE7C7|nr:S41 family peptidase [Phenylobacterium sp.]
MKILLASALALSLAFAAPSFAQQAISPRASVGKIADAIASRYFDEAKAAKIAAELRAEARKGAYDKLTDPRDFAVALTDRLRPQDGHFAVSWSPPVAASADAVPVRRGPPSFLSRRGGYGFAAVKVLPGNIGYVDLRGFADFTPDGDQSAREAADAALALVAGTDALIFDLRENGGGSPAMVGYLIGHFVPQDARIYNVFKTRGEPDADEAPIVPIKGQRRLDTPLYVLTSGRTASAAESFAYTLQAAGRASVVGERSAGGANPGGSVPVGEGLSVFVSDGAPVNPITGTNWEGTGVQPDVQAPAAQALTRAQVLALTRLASAPLGEPALTENRWALEALAPAPKLEAARLAAFAGTYGAYEVGLDGERLLLRTGRRPPSILVPLDEAGLFVVAGEPSRRVRFEAAALVFLAPDGSAARQARNTLPATAK